MVFRMISNKLPSGLLFAFALVTAIVLLTSPTLIAQGSLGFFPVGEPMDVASSDFGNKSIGLVTNSSDELVLCFGGSGHLYVCKWDNTSQAFTEPTAIDPEENIFMSDSEGPQMAAYGDDITLTYMLSGDWDTGARSVSSHDGGVTWGAPVSMVPEATTDHFMPCVGMDPDGDPFAGVKVGTNSVYEGILKSNDGGTSWLPAVNASEAVNGDAVCECCPSLPFWGNGRYYDLVRNNNNNVRDFWLLGSDDGVNWDTAVDMDPIDWVINSCPASGPTVCGPLPDGSWRAAFMNGGGVTGQSRVYVSSMDLEANNGAGALLGTVPVTVNQFENATQNNPTMDLWSPQNGDPIIALAWEQNSGGYDVQLAVSNGTTLTDIAVNLTGEWSGQHRRPQLAFTGTDDMPTLHLVWQNSSDGTVKYLKGGIEIPFDVREPHALPLPACKTTSTGVILNLPESWSTGDWTLWDVQGRHVSQGPCSRQNEIFIDVPSAGNWIVSVVNSNGNRWSHQVVKPQ